MSQVSSVGSQDFQKIWFFSPKIWFFSGNLIFFFQNLKIVIKKLSTNVLNWVENKTYLVIFEGIYQHRELLFSCHRELLFSSRKVILVSSRITEFSKSVRKVILVETRIVTNENYCSFFIQSYGEISNSRLRWRKVIRV